jgi:hypothetical protein
MCVCMVKTAYTYVLKIVECRLPKMTSNRISIRQRCFISQKHKCLQNILYRSTRSHAWINWGRRKLTWAIYDSIPLLSSNINIFRSVILFLPKHYYFHFYIIRSIMSIFISMLINCSMNMKNYLFINELKHHQPLNLFKNEIFYRSRELNLTPPSHYPLIVSRKSKTFYSGTPT